MPKQIALRAPEAAAVRIAPLLNFISIVAAPVVWILDRSGQLVLKLLGQSGAPDRKMSDEEIRHVLSEAESAGIMNKAETDMIAGVMRIADRTARGLMVPRGEVEVVGVTDSPDRIIHRFRETGHLRLPVRDAGPDDIIGVLKSRDFLDTGEQGAQLDTEALIFEAPVVRDGMAALDVLEALRKSPAHMVLVYDEYGHFEGIITPMDVLEAIAGEFPEGEEAKIVARADGSLLVAGWMPVDEFAERIGMTLDKDRDFETVAGLVIEKMGALPGLGEHVDIGDWRVEVIDIDGRRIDKLLVQPHPKS
ncbi:putative hemolysin [Roseovarius sp. MBR-154]